MMRDSSNMVADNLKRLMRQRKISSSQLADAIGVSPNTISRIMTGSSTGSPRTLDKIAKYFDISRNELYQPQLPLWSDAVQDRGLLVIDPREMELIKLIRVTKSPLLLNALTRIANSLVEFFRLPDETNIQQPGAIINIESIDKVLISEQLERLKQYPDLQVVLTDLEADFTQVLDDFPNSKLTASASSRELIREILFHTNRSFQFIDKILPNTKVGKTVIVAYYSLASQVYSSNSSAQHYVRALSSFLPAANLNIILDVSVETAIRNLKRKKMKSYYSKLMLTKVRRAYQDYVDQNSCVAEIIDSERADSVTELILEILKRRAFIGGLR